MDDLLNGAGASSPSGGGIFEMMRRSVSTKGKLNWRR